MQSRTMRERLVSNARRSVGNDCVCDGLVGGKKRRHFESAGNDNVLDSGATIKRIVSDGRHGSRNGNRLEIVASDKCGINDVSGPIRNNDPNEF